MASDEYLSLREQLRMLVEEARMILPGIQALFGFQTIAVFNQRFGEMSAVSVGCHLVALGLTVIAIALVMAPAAYHRMTQPALVSGRIISVCSHMICWSLLPLACSLALDLYVVTLLATRSLTLAMIGAAFTFGIMLGLWFGPALRFRIKQGPAQFP